jgi:hypothetical protein
MSGWAAYIQTLTESCGEIRRAAIVGLNDGSVWARTEGGNEFKVFLETKMMFINQYPKYKGN